MCDRSKRRIITRMEEAKTDSCPLQPPVEWSDDVAWEPKVKMTMSSETANRYFQGKEKIAIAIARRRIKTGGDVKAALAIMPITKPVFGRYREMIASDYPHLEV